MTATKGNPESLTFRESEMKDIVKIFKTLSEPSKVRILSLLNRQEILSVGSIEKLLTMEISLVSHHLSKLKDLGFVKSKKEGRQVFYSIEDDCVIDILRRARDHVSGN